MIKKNILTIIATMLLTTGCNEPNKVEYLLFLDYTDSATTFKGDNPIRLKESIKKIWDNAKGEFEIFIYPIYAFTESALPLLKKSNPDCPGDLTRPQCLKDKFEEFMNDLDNKVLKENGITSSSKQGTNIYPIIRKIGQYHKMNDKKVYIVSDMKHEFNDEKLHEILLDPKIDAVRYAKEKVTELEYNNILSGVEIVIGFPSSCDPIDEILRVKLSKFWREFFQLSGADVSFDYL